jgi:DNA-binding XRE family transcriptional regulator
MTPAQFMQSVAALQDKGIIPAGHGWKTALANKLGVTRTTIDNFEKHGTKQVQTDYAIAALLAGLEPAAMRTWHPINTAPRDRAVRIRTDVDGDKMPMRFHEPHWWTAPNGIIRIVDADLYPGNDMIKATHWAEP